MVSVKKLLAKLGLREIKNNWKQFLAIIAIGAIAVTLFVGLMANAENFSSRVETTFRNGNMADLWVTTLSYDERDEAAIKHIVQDKGSVESRFEIMGQAGHHSVYVAVTDGEPAISHPYDLQKNDQDTSDYFVRIDESLGSTDPSKAALGSYTLGGDFDITLDMSAFTSRSSWLSDLLKLERYYDDEKNPLKAKTLVLDFKVTGLMKFPENIAKSSYNNSTIIISDKAFHKAFDEMLYGNMKSELSEEDKIKEINVLHEILTEASFFQGDGTMNYEGRLLCPNQYLIKLNEGEDSSLIKKSVNEYFKSKTANNLLSTNDRSDMPFVITVHNDVEQARNFTFLFPFVFFLVAVLVILTTTSQIILKERMQIGTMKALGLKNGEIMSLYVAITLALVGIGTLIGEIVGPILIPWIMDKKYAIIYTLPTLGYVFPWFTGILTAVSFLLIAAGVTYFIARREISLKPCESMRPRPRVMKSYSLKIEPKHGITFLSLKMALRNMFSDVVKSIMVIVGIVGCTALLVCGFGIEDTINYGLDHDRALGNSQDISLTFSSIKTKGDIEDDLMGIEGVKSFEMYTRATSTISYEEGHSADSFIFILGENGSKSHMKYVPEMPLDQVAISQKISDSTGAKAGDTVTFTYSNVTYSATVYDVYEAFVYNGVIVYGDSPVLGDWGGSYSGCNLDILDGYEPKEVKEKLLSLSYVMQAQTQEDWAKSVSDVMGGILIMTNAVKVFAILLAITVLYNLALMNFKDRTRDIATLKVLGFSRAEIAFPLIFEMMALVAIGVGIGLFAGIPFHMGVMTLNKVELVHYLFHINPLSFVFSFVLTFVVALLVNGFYSFQSDSVKMVESLKSVE